MSNKETLAIIIGVTVVSLAIYLILGWCAAYVLSAIFNPGTSDSRKKIDL